MIDQVKLRLFHSCGHEDLVLGDSFVSGQRTDCPGRFSYSNCVLLTTALWLNGDEELIHLRAAVVHGLLVPRDPERLVHIVPIFRTKYIVY